MGIDFAGAVEPVFGAPPLLNEELARGRIDAVLTYWHYAARLEASGARVFLSVTDMIRRLGIDSQVPMLGYAFREEWADREGIALQGLIGASRDAKALLASSQDEWIRLAPLIGTHDPAVLGTLQAGFRVGTPDRWSEAERQAASDLYAILVRIGGDKLVGSAMVLDVKTFWPSISY